jgi:hypothetical protein
MQKLCLTVVCEDDVCAGETEDRLMNFHKMMILDPLPRVLLTSVLVWAVLFTAGCGGSSSDLATVRGVVTYDGKQLPEFKHASVVFTPEGGRPAKGIISAQDGGFELSTYGTNDGARIGRHTVAVNATVDDPNAETEDKYPGVRFVIPQKFSNRDTSGLVFDVKPGTNVIQIQLRSSGPSEIISQ